MFIFYLLQVLELCRLILSVSVSVFILIFPFYFHIFLLFFFYFCFIYFFVDERKDNGFIEFVSTLHGDFIHELVIF